MNRTTMASLHSDDGGQISALGVLAAAAFACLLLLVINTGYATNGKIEMQNAADATAISGATWMARGLNIISLNNVTETQLLAIVMLIPALDEAFDLALLTLEGELALCVASVVAAPICAPILEAQIYGVTAVVQPVILPPLRVLARRPGPLWTAMNLLTLMSNAIAHTFPLVAEAESFRIARQDGAELGVLIPARLTVDGWPSLPVHAGTMVPDLCDPIHNGSRAAMGDRGYAPLLGYDVNQGPLGRFSDAIDPFLYPIVNSLIHLYFHALREVHYRELCGGSGPVLKERPVKTLAECKALGGGTAVWQVIVYDTVLFSAPQDPSSITLQDIEGASRRLSPIRPDPDCSWTPTDAVSIGPGRYRKTEETIEKYRYHVYDYEFLAASVSEPDTGQRDVNAPPAGNNDPYPYLLGGDKNSTKESARRELRYLAILYRSRKVSVAPDYFISPLGEHRLAYAQSKVYNPTAWDTFTQDWRATLEPASMLEDDTFLGALGSPGLSSVIAKSASAGNFHKSRVLEGLLHELNVLKFLNNH